jgi:hypothetical protein
VVTFTARFQTSLAVGATELVQVTGRYVGGKTTTNFISAISTVEKSIAFLLRRKANSARTFEIFALTTPVTWKLNKNCDSIKTNQKNRKKETKK